MTIGEASPERLRELLLEIVGERHLQTSPEHHDAVGRLVGEGIREFGWEVEEHPLRGPFGVGANVVGRKLGVENPERYWIVGAHYDTVVGTPGADDNGIAVAGLLELARLLGDCHFADTVDLVAWDMEEVQTPRDRGLLGSRAMAAEAHAGRRELAGVISLEMIGFRNPDEGSQRFPKGFGLLFPGLTRRVRSRGSRGDFIAAIGNRGARHLLAGLEEEGALAGVPIFPVVVQGLARLIPDFHRSDHAPFWRRGYPAVMLTDTAEFRSGHYHRPTDTEDRIDDAFAGRVTTAVARTIARMAHANPAAIGGPE